jgi:hypothetical protein
MFVSDLITSKYSMNTAAVDAVELIYTKEKENEI